MYRAVCKIHRSGERAAHIAHCAKVFAGISGGARTCTTAFNRKVPACNLACRMFMRRRCKSIRVFTINRIGITAFHQPVCSQQGHNLFRRKIALRQRAVCRSLNGRQVGNDLIQQGTQNICNHVELLACRLSVQTADNRSPAAFPILQRNVLLHARHRKRRSCIIFKRSCTTFCHNKSPPVN